MYTQAEIIVKLYLIFLCGMCCNCKVAALPAESSNIEKPQEAAAFVQESLNKIVNIQQQYENQQADLLLQFDDAPDKREALRTVLNDYQKAFKQISLQARSFNLQEIADVTTRQAVDELTYSGGMLNLGSDFIQLIENIHNLEMFFKQENLTLYDENEVSYNIDAQNMQKSTENWQKWHEKLSANSETLLLKTVDIIRKHARDFNMTATEFWFPTYSEDLMSQIEQAVQRLKPLYAKVHAYVRQKLITEYGAEVIGTSGRIPEHLYKYAQENAWNSRTPEEGSAPTSIFKALNYNALDILHNASNFYVSLGFDELSDEIWEENILEVAGETEIFCPGSIYGSSLNLTLFYCDRVNFEAYATHHSLILSLYANQLRKELPAYFDYDYELETAIGDAVKLAVASRKHLSTFGWVETEAADKHVQRTNLRLAISTLFSLMYAYVEVKLMLGLLSGELDRSQLNEHYWELMTEHAGVEAPLPRDKDSLDLPYSFYADLNDYSDILHKCDKHILTYQLYRAICAQSGHSGPLSECDFSGNKQIGEVLKKMLAAGSSRPYEELLSLLLKDSQKLDATALLEYFAPTEKWIDSQQIKKVVWMQHR